MRGFITNRKSNVINVLKKYQGCAMDGYCPNCKASGPFYNLLFDSDIPTADCEMCGYRKSIFDVTVIQEQTRPKFPSPDAYIDETIKRLILRIE